MFDFDSLLPPGLGLYPHQTCGVATALLLRRLILADDQGSGKTLQALVALEADEAYPAVVVCPADLEAHWVSLAARFLPNRQVFVAAGRPRQCAADIVVISYRLLAAWLPLLDRVNAAVFDDSHHVCGPLTRRAVAARSLAQRVPEDGIVLSLSAAPFLTSPAKVAAQLQLIGRLHNFAPDPEAADNEQAWVDSFLKAWCSDEPSLRQLHRALGQHCYVRRGRKDLMGLTDGRRAVVRLSLGPELDDYREAEVELASYLAEHGGAATSEAFARLAELRRLVGEAKVWAARRWADDVLRSNPERCLIAVARHPSVHQGLAERYRPPHLFGPERDADDEERRCGTAAGSLTVAPLSAGSEGHTFARGADVVFVELSWAPGTMTLAEDWGGPPGQDTGRTFAWYLLAAGTIDELAWEIVERKRRARPAGPAESQEELVRTDQATAVELLEGFFQRGPLGRRIGSGRAVRNLPRGAGQNAK